MDATAQNWALLPGSYESGLENASGEDKTHFFSLRFQTQKKVVSEEYCIIYTRDDRSYYKDDLLGRLFKGKILFNTGTMTYALFAWGLFYSGMQRPLTARKYSS